MASSLAKQPHHRQPTRSNSASSSSVVTVTRATSTRNGSRPNPSSLKPQSPTEINFNPPSLSLRNLSPDNRRRSSAAHNRPDSGHGIREGVGNLNRWSQSTVSSKSSTTHNRRNSFSKRLSGSLGSFGGFASPQSSSPKGKGIAKPRPSTSTTPEEAPNHSSPSRYPKQAAPTLPPIVTLSSLTQAVEAADSPSTAATATPATADLLSSATYQPQPDYFGDRWRARSPLSQQRANPSSRKPSPNPSPGVAPTSSKLNHHAVNPEFNHTATSTDRAVSKFSKRGSVQQKERRQDPQPSIPRSKGPINRGSGPAETEGSASAGESHDRDRRAPSQKAMLSKALQKANHAVLLDNAQNFEGAMDAYADACALLQRVMLRSSGDEDRKKLESVNADGKALPCPPGGWDSAEQEPISPLTDEEDDIITMDNATTTRLSGDRVLTADSRTYQNVARAPTAIPPRRHSLRPADSRLEGQPPPVWEKLRPKPQRHKSQPRNPSGLQRPTLSLTKALEPPMLQTDIPPPLSPRRLPSLNPPPQEPPPPPSSAVDTSQALNDHLDRRQHVRRETAESTSWLDTIDESGGSSASSVHSRTSSIGLRRKRIRAASGATEAEFDAALDAAVEAAYDDGFEPANDDYYNPEDISDAPYEDEPSTYVSDARHNVELAKERVREAEREAAIAAAKDREKRRLQEKFKGRDSIDSGLSDNEADEEEQILEEMTRGYILDSEYNGQSKSALPRQSGSSTFSGRTWGSSTGSNPTSAGTSLSVGAGIPALPSLPAELQTKQMPPPAHPPPSGALPSLPMSLSNGSPVKSPNEPPPGVRNGNPGVRERRLSGIKAPQLKIETSAKVLSVPVAPAPKTQEPSVPAPLSTSTLTEPPKSAFAVPPSQQALPSLSLHSPAATLDTKADSRKGSSPMPVPGSAETTSNGFPLMPALYKTTTADSEDSVPSMPGSPARLISKNSAGPGTLRKNFSSSSLKKILTASVPESSEPGSSASTVKQRKTPTTAIPVVPTPKGADFIIEAILSDGIHLFDSDIHSPVSPGTPNPMAANAPLPLEPCPESTLLRPFWFLRCICQSITHPRGGYLSTRLFVPRDIWKVTNVKLKNVDEKVSSCDLLTATLLKLAKVDTFDANAVLEEMQFLESIMDQSRVSLSKKLGSEVGVANAAWLSKTSNASGESLPNGDVFGGKSGNVSTKSYLSSWRKKMSKNTSAGPGSVMSTVTNISKDGCKESPAMKSVPMTASQKPRMPQRDLSQVQYVGPHSHYMAALARLCDAAQILGKLAVSVKPVDQRANMDIDQIARGVEDPGLKHSSLTHVGLELSARNAAEFFGFYICRFVHNDIGLMLDKFIKKGSQWVLA
ncbi:MAG: hypothetical protein Q9179_004914 [Wetmoreana sp. 5 TL-2023]